MLSNFSSGHNVFKRFLHQPEVNGSCLKNISELVTWNLICKEIKGEMVLQCFLLVACL